MVLENSSGHGIYKTVYKSSGYQPLTTMPTNMMMAGGRERLQGDLVLTTSVTSRLASVVFKMADKVDVEEAIKNIEFARKIPI